MSSTANVIAGLARARYCAECFTWLGSFNPHSNPRGEQLYSRVTSEETEAGEVR